MAERDSNVVVSAFTEEQVAKLTGVTKRQLRWWDKKDFFKPSLATEPRRSPYSRLYSFKDVVSLKVLSTLRNECNVTLPHLREVKDTLAHLGDHLWSVTTLYVLDRRVIFVHPETEAREDIVSRQTILAIPLIKVSGTMEEAIRNMPRREESSIGKTERHRGIAHNQVVIAGTRIPVRSVKAFANAGYTPEQIKKEYPSLTDADIRTAIAFVDAA